MGPGEPTKLTSRPVVKQHDDRLVMQETCESEWDRVEGNGQPREREKRTRQNSKSSRWIWRLPTYTVCPSGGVAWVVKAHIDHVEDVGANGEMICGRVPKSKVTLANEMQVSHTSTACQILGASLLDLRIAQGQGSEALCDGVRGLHPSLGSAVVLRSLRDGEAAMNGGGCVFPHRHVLRVPRYDRRGPRPPD